MAIGLVRGPNQKKKSKGSQATLNQSVCLTSDALVQYRYSRDTFHTKNAELDATIRYTANFEVSRYQGIRLERKTQ